MQTPRPVVTRVASHGSLRLGSTGSGGGGDEAAVEQTEFDVVLTGFGDKKLDVVRKVKSLVGGTLIEAKKLVEGCPATIKEKADKEEAEKIKTDLEGAGASVELK